MAIRARHVLAALLFSLGALLACKGIVGPSADCGTRPDDWCRAVSGDPCASHANSKECAADPRCEALPYRGESAVGCQTDERCFASNCPAVGCISRCEELDEKGCRRDEPCLWQGQGGDCKAGDRRCKWDGAKCVRAVSCIHGFPSPPSKGSAP